MIHILRVGGVKSHLILVTRASSEKMDVGTNTSKTNAEF